MARGGYNPRVLTYPGLKRLSFDPVGSPLVCYLSKRWSERPAGEGAPAAFLETRYHLSH